MQSQRERIKRGYKRGAKQQKIIKGESRLTNIEKLVKQEVACHLKAGGFSYTYIAEALQVGPDVIKKWFSDEKLDLDAKVVEIQDDYLGGAVKLLKTYAIELIEMLVEIARTTPEDKIAIQAITEALDRMGLAKVNKSESEVTNRNKAEVEITDKTGFVEKMNDAPPEVQAAVARKLEEAFALATEHTDDVKVT